MPDYTTTKFWVSVGALAGGVVLIIAGHEDIGLPLLVGVVGAYVGLKVARKESS